MTPDVLARKISRVEDKLQQIAALLPHTLAEFASARSTRDLCAFYLAMAIEDCIDIAEHIIARNGWGTPDSSGAAFRLLAERKTLTLQLAEQMAQAGGMRNAILHQYDNIDWQLVFLALQDLSRIREFLVAVRR